MKYNEMPDMETIKRYWGSLEAYQEEQRRTALVSLEEVETGLTENWKWDFSRWNRSQTTNTRREGPSFRLFGHQN